jgi:hypothetical protein
MGGSEKLCLIIHEQQIEMLRALLEIKRISAGRVPQGARMNILF